MRHLAHLALSVHGSSARAARNWRLPSYGFVAAVIVAVSMASAADWAAAEKIEYDLTFSASEAVLDNPGNMLVQKLAGWQMPGVLVNERSRPIFDLQNTSDLAEITTFRLELSKTQFNIESFNVLDANGVTIAGNIVMGGDAVELDFTNFAVGTTVRFQIQLRPDDPMAFQNPDFRLGPLFDINGANSADNAIVTVTFDSPNFGVNSLVDQMPDYPSTGPVIDPNAAMAGKSMDFVQVFDLTDQAELVPEPSGLLLLLWGGPAALLWVRRRRRQR